MEREQENRRQGEIAKLLLRIVKMVIPEVRARLREDWKILRKRAAEKAWTIMKRK